MQLHTFHIPVMGLGYTIDTPLKVGKYGISSVVSIIEDELIEEMREYHSYKNNIPFIPIPQSDIDHRWKRICAYLNLLQHLLDKQVDELKSEDFTPFSDITKYFELLPENSNLKKIYNIMNELYGEKKTYLQDQLRQYVRPGAIDVNIMTKCDKTNYDVNGDPLPIEYNDALAALKGFAESNLSSSVIFSAGLNPRLYSYCEQFNDFFPDEDGGLRKKIILKVSDFRSALIQGKILAKKGLWVSEYRIESGLNCGGHAFATDGILLGPILQEFKDRKYDLKKELFEMCVVALKSKSINTKNFKPELKISVQGGIGTFEEDSFLQEYFNVNGTGWGSPFLLVPEATNVDEQTLDKLINAEPTDYFLSYSSPLGVPFNNFKKSSSEEQRKERIAKGRPGSPCYKKFLSFNTEFSEKAICTASREYQYLKIQELLNERLEQVVFTPRFNKIIEKECLCEGLGSSVLLKNNIPPHHKLSAVAICPGPNLAYFSKILSLHEMVDHIYGRINILGNQERPHIFINELKLYIEYLKNEIQRNLSELSDKKNAYYLNFKENLLKGINFYRNMLNEITPNFQASFQKLKADLGIFESELEEIRILCKK